MSKKKENGGADGDRTHNLCIANAALSQLSYGPVSLGSIISAEISSGKE